MMCIILYNIILPLDNYEPNMNFNYNEEEDEDLLIDNNGDRRAEGVQKRRELMNWVLNNY